MGEAVVRESPPLMSPDGDSRVTERSAERSISPVRAGLVYAAFTVHFVLLLVGLFPWLRDGLQLHPALCWFLTGYALFVPMAVLSILLTRRQGAVTGGEIALALRLKPLGSRDWLTVIGGTILVVLLTGAIATLVKLLGPSLGVPPLKTTPWFLAFEPLQGAEQLLLIVWAGMFVFNILGEELLWRGYLQSRMDARAGWMWGSAFWAVFHLPFGLNLLIILLPVLVLLPYVVHRTGNTSVGVAIHALYNGPAFLLIALGVVR